MSPRCEFSLPVIRWAARLLSGGLTVFLACVIAIACSSHQRPTELEFKTADTLYVVRFQSSRISEAQMRELVVLSPLVTDYAGVPSPPGLWAVASVKGARRDKSLVPLPLDRCITADAAYSGCSKNSPYSGNYLQNAEVNLERSRQGLQWLRSLSHPAELDPVLAYLTGKFALLLSVEERQLRFYKTADQSVLKEALDKIEPAFSCSDALSKIASAPSRDSQFGAVATDWSNCMRTAVEQQFPQYPLEAWERFLKAYGINEDYKEQTPD